jgi:hypothetical protein
VLEAFCAANGLTLDAAKYGAIVQNIVDDDVKARANDIKGACGLSHQADTEKFKLSLASIIQRKMAVYRELAACIFDRK